jgi:adenylate cyclase
VDLLSALANAAAVALEQAGLQLEIRRAQRDRERLGRYLPPVVVERVIGDSASDVGLVAHEAEVTILFCDMVGFTSRAEGLPPAVVMSMLNHYFGRMTDVIFEHEGTLDKFIGDCLMAAFGAPLAQPDHAARAARAALGLRDAVRELNAASGESLGFRIGLNSGAVVAGDVGSPRRREWTVVGSTVNLASRTEGMAQRDQILLTQFTRPLLGPEFEVRSVGPRRPKGMSADIEMFELVGIGAGARA